MVVTSRGRVRLLNLLEHLDWALGALLLAANWIIEGRLVILLMVSIVKVRLGSSENVTSLRQIVIKLVTQWNAIFCQTGDHLTTLCLKVGALVANRGAKRGRLLVTRIDLPMEVKVRREHILILYVWQISTDVSLFLAFGQRFCLELSVLCTEVAQWLMIVRLVINIFLATMLTYSSIRMILFNSPELLGLWLTSRRAKPLESCHAIFTLCIVDELLVRLMGQSAAI